ncbi:petrobactin ABC transporter substrate-binding protein YclQ [Arthrobacter tumbae]|uniref:siderophore ABC transporter substrate-binding protein n=1 Tax=Arthrobacter tumbae TaxID=163874 RepID=UPI00195D6727|nr:siderophore ABC transporter substrate-binding protein [Arthrobacter tumbae]MBM7780763.1 iron complex transport system substrate-binding protein [Arthrobacter tumbae]
MKNPVKLKVAAAAAVSALTLSACGGTADAGSGQAANGAGTTLTVEHAQGSTEVSVSPETVYTFDLGVLDSLNSLGVTVAGVPQATLPESLAAYEADGYTKIGSMKEPDFEAIAAGAPDLIIISGRTADYYDELSEIAPTIDLSVDQAAQVESFKDVSTTLGRIFEQEDEVAERLTAIDASVADAKANAAEAGTGLVVLTSGGELTAYGAGSRFGLIHDVLGVKPAADISADGAHGQSISFEFIAETDPDHLFVIDRDSAIGESGDAASAVLDNELVNGTTAAAEDNIAYLDAASWYLVGYGLGNVEAMISSVNDALTN